MGRRVGAAVTGLAGLFTLGCVASADFARAALNGVSLPAMAALHRLSAPMSFPIAEPLALGLLAVAACALLRALASAAYRRSMKPLKRCVAGLLCGTILLTSALALLWGPASALPFEDPPAPGPKQLEWLCSALIDALNASPLIFPDANQCLASAPEVAGLHGRVMKAARWPEWMRLCHICGLFVPLTGEALVDAGAPAPLVPFTAVHELMHLAGVADEGAANIEAWRRCMASGGAFADSARLWALRYAMGMLASADASAHLRVRGKMKDPLAQVFDQVNGEAETRNGYGAVVAALCMDSEYQAPNSRLFRFPSAPLRAPLAPASPPAALARADHAAQGKAQRGGDQDDQRDIP